MKPAKFGRRADEGGKFGSDGFDPPCVGGHMDSVKIIANSVQILFLSSNVNMGFVIREPVRPSKKQESLSITLV